MRKKEAAIEALDLAKKYIHYFEDVSPDSRPRLAIETLERWIDGLVTIGECRSAAFAAHAAARECEDGRPRWAARICGQAVSVAHVARHLDGVKSYVRKITNSN